MAELKKYVVDGIEAEIDIEVMKKWSVASLINRIQAGDNLASVDLIERILGSAAGAVLSGLDADGDPDSDRVAEWFEKLMEAMAEDLEAKN
jgi:hypothetical protein